MHKTIQYSLVFVTTVLLISSATVEDASAQIESIRKACNLYGGSISVDFSPDGKYIATGDTDGEVRLWEVGSDEEIYYRNLGGEVQGVAFRSDGKYLAADGYDGGVKAILLEVSSGREVRNSYIHDEAGNINSVAYSPDGRYVAIAVDLRWAYLWDLNSDRKFGWGRTDASEVYAVAFSPDGKYLAIGNDNGKALLWELSSWWTDDVTSRNMDAGGNVQAVAFSPDGKYLAADGYDGSDTNVSIYNVSSSTKVWQIDHDHDSYAIAFSPDGEYLAVGGDDERITLYRIRANITKEKVILASGKVRDLAWSPDGTLISDGRTVWEIHF